MMAVGAGAMMTVGGAEMTVETMEETTTSSVLRIMPMSVCVCVCVVCVCVVVLHSFLCCVARVPV